VTGPGRPAVDPGAAGPGADRIEIRALRVDAVHGVHEEERRAPQPFEVDLDLYLDLSEAAVADDLARTTDYGRAVAVAGAVMAGPPRQLLETLAGDIAEALLAELRVRTVTVAVRKLRPPVPEQLGSAGVRITRSRL
jgi:dihydroneopterin aldolase